jgi:hypothetical protein
MVAYNRSYQHFDWNDNQDIVQAGGPRGFNAEFHALEAEFDKIGGVVTQLNAGLGAFQPVGAAGAVAYAGGNVGIGTTFSTATPPAYRLEVNLGPNTSTTEQVRFGNAVCSSGVGIFTAYAVFSHQNHNSNSNCALRQSPDGEVNINAPIKKTISIRQNGTNIRLAISADGNVIVGSGGETELGGSTAVLQVSGDACKTGGGSWSVCSDARLKENVRELEAGLAELRRVRPVRFRYNGRAGTPAGQEGVGVLGQEVEKVFPEMIRRVPGEPGLQDLRIYDGSALTFVLVNAVKELAGKVEQLEQRLAEARKEHGSDGTTG